ncbi:LuxR C-terminal-related transcriptional regulator [Sphingomonas sp. dw_22]|uniref:helix-turn-helix transcriptional regulator n=1 Tax=Sphingomonas sp. dw_22 TaxID=2721175 RepID=UPI001BD28DAD|nr:LuxR C-terminal-related transcriptional regulator [Sphingomonas sp. dw_22]
MFASGAFSRHVSPDARGDATPAERAGLMAAGSLAALVGDLSACDTAEMLREWLLRFAHGHGFLGGRYLHLGHFHSGQRAPHWKLLRFLSTHDDRADLWVTEEIGAGTMLFTFLPFAWSNGDGEGLTPAQREWYAVTTLTELPAGVTVPVQDHAAGPACLILFGGSEQDALDLIELETPSLAVTALAFHLLAKLIVPGSNALGPALSDREIACLRLAALGDTLADTAAQLGVSVRTVELHVGRASKKLNAANKVHAVAIAIGAGLIQV